MLRLEQSDIAKSLYDIEEVSFAGIIDYETETIFREQYEEILDEKESGHSSGSVRSRSQDGWKGSSVREALSHAVVKEEKSSREEGVRQPSNLTGRLSGPELDAYNQARDEDLGEAQRMVNDAASHFRCVFGE